MNVVTILLMVLCASEHSEHAPTDRPVRTNAEAARISTSHEHGRPTLYKKLGIPEELLTTSVDENGNPQTFGGDVRIGDLDGDKAVDFLVFRSVDGAKPVFMGAFTMDGEVLWKVGEGGNQPVRPGPAAIHDIDGDGRDEVNGGYYLIGPDGTPKWEKQLGRHMDSVAITQWDNGHIRAVCSGFGHVMDDKGNVILKLGEKLVPHGQEVRVADFLSDLAGPEMIIRYNGHDTAVMLVSNDGQVRRKFDLNHSPNNTGMEVVYWNGPHGAALLYNGGRLFDAYGDQLFALKELGEPVGPARMGWYHCIPANVCGDEREEVLLYNPWDRWIYIYTASPLKPQAFTGYRASPRQYNARLMD